MSQLLHFLTGGEGGIRTRVYLAALLLSKKVHWASMRPHQGWRRKWGSNPHALAGPSFQDW